MARKLITRHLIRSLGMKMNGEPVWLHGFRKGVPTWGEQKNAWPYHDRAQAERIAAKHRGEVVDTEIETHRFEAAGLGTAPFTYLGIEEKRGPIVHDHPDGTRTEIGSPGQAMGSCNYCSTGIAYCYWIKGCGADDQPFYVGSECVRHTGDRRIVERVESEEKQRKRKLAREARERRLPKERERIDAAKSLLESDPTLFASDPHPQGFDDRETGEPLSLRDYFEWMFRHAGHTGRLKVTRAIEKAQKEATK